MSDLQQQYKNIKLQIDNLKEVKRRDLDHVAKIYNSLEATSALLDSFIKDNDYDKIDPMTTQMMSLSGESILGCIPDHDNNQYLPFKQIESSMQLILSNCLSGISENTCFSHLRKEIETNKIDIISTRSRFLVKFEKWPFLNEYAKSLVDKFDKAKTDPLNFNDIATNFRELLRELFEQIAPDEEIEKCHWYKDDKNGYKGVTRTDRVIFAVCSYIGINEFSEQLNVSVDYLCKNINKKISALSSLTHVTKKTYSYDKNKAIPMFNEVMELFLLLFETIDEANKEFEQLLNKKVDKTVSSYFWKNGIKSELDEIATHCYIDGVSDIEILSVEVDNDYIHFTGSGNVDCDHQFGSNSDVRKGDGFEFSGSSPLSFDGHIPVDDLSSVEITSISADTSAHWGDEEQSSPTI